MNNITDVINDLKDNYDKNIEIISKAKNEKNIPTIYADMMGNILKKFENMSTAFHKAYDKNAITKFKNEYVNKLYDMAKPCFEELLTKYGLIDKPNSKDIYTILINLYNDIKKYIKIYNSTVFKEIKNNEDTVKIDILINIKTACAYYLITEYEDIVDSKCRAKYYEILRS